MKTKDTETRKTKTQEDENLVLPKEQVENAALYKPALNKIMTTREYYMKYNFVAPLIFFCSDELLKSVYCLLLIYLQF